MIGIFYIEKEKKIIVIGKQNINKISEEKNVG